MYKTVLGVEFNNQMGGIVKAVLKRHDIVHRNGKTKSGEDIVFDKNGVTELVDKVGCFIQDIDIKLRETRSKTETQPNPDVSVDF